jgi:hypothetical protein
MILAQFLRTRSLAAAFEELHLTLMLLGSFARGEGPEVSAFAGLGVGFTRIETILARCKFADHDWPPHGTLVRGPPRAIAFANQQFASPMPALWSAAIAAAFFSSLFFLIAF